MFFINKKSTLCHVIAQLTVVRSASSLYATCSPPLNLDTSDDGIVDAMAAAKQRVANARIVKPCPAIVEPRLRMPVAWLIYLSCRMRGSILIEVIGYQHEG